MDYFELVKIHQSIRKYELKPVGEDLLRQILETTNKAPSAGNLQAFEIYIVREEEQRVQLSIAALNQDFIQEASIILVFCSNPGRSEWKYKQRGVNLYSVQDATIACTYAMLAATALGLACVWVGAFNEMAVREIIRAPGGEKPVAILPIGYAAEISPARQRRDLEDLVHFV